MSIPLELCDDCLPWSIRACDDLFFYCGLTANTFYKVEIKNHFEQTYTATIRTDADGNLTIDPSLYPDGIFNSNAGFFILTVYQNKAVVNITYGYEAYPCISFDIYDDTTV